MQQQSSLNSEPDTCLTGASVSGNRLQVYAGRDLRVSSEQDPEDHRSRQRSISDGGSISLGSVDEATGSINTSCANLDSHYASARQQSVILLVRAIMMCILAGTSS